MHGTGAVTASTHLIYKLGGRKKRGERREEERQEGRRRYKKALGPGMSFRNLSGPHAPTRPHLLILMNGTKQTNILAYGGPFSFKPPHPSKCVKSVYNSVSGRTHR